MVACSCGVVFDRWIMYEDDAEDLLPKRATSAEDNSTPVGFT
jgi:hypothetical protein